MNLDPGNVPLRAWAELYRGAKATLADSCWSKIEKSAASVAKIVGRGEPVYGINTGFGKLANIRIAAGDLEALQRNIVLSHSAGVGPAMPQPIVRLMMGLKIASLAQGYSGVTVATVKLLVAMLERGVLPVVPSQGSVGASGDLAPLSHMTATMIGVGSVTFANETMPAADGLARAGLQPLTLGAKEGLALLNGTQFSAAYAIAALSEAERLFQAALVTGALSTDAAKGSDTPFDARIQDPYCLRCQPQVMGACLDSLRGPATVLGHEANGVVDNPLIFPDTDEALSGGNFHAEPIALAADTMAIALCEIGSLAERRIAMLVDPALSGLPAFLTPKPGLTSGFMIPQVTAAALVSENKQRAYPASVDSIPTSANQEDHVSMAAHGARRLLEMTANLANVIGIELLTAAQACDFHTPLKSSARLEAARTLLRKDVPTLTDDRYFAPDMGHATMLVASGALAEAVGGASLPTLF